MMTKSQAGRLGGLALLENKGQDYFKSLGAKGGRPRLLTLAELQQCQAQEVKVIKEEQLPDSLSQLKRLYKQILKGEVSVEA